jgi:hypothetical protein
MTVCARDLLKLAYYLLSLSFVYLFCVTFVPIPETGEDNAKYIVGFLVGTGLTTIIAYFFRKHQDDPPDNIATDTHTESSSSSTSSDQTISPPQ